MAKPEGLRVVMVIAGQQFRDEELFEPRRLLQEAGVEVRVASSHPGPATGMLGGKVTPELLYTALRSEEWDGVVFVGGMGAKQYFEDAGAHALAREAAAAGKLVAAICIAPSILANAGILAGKNATAYPCEEGNLRARGARFTGAPVTVDGRVVTGSGPEAAAEFGRALVRVLCPGKAT